MKKALTTVMVAVIAAMMLIAPLSFAAGAGKTDTSGALQDVYADDPTGTYGFVINDGDIEESRPQIAKFIKEVASDVTVSEDSELSEVVQALVESYLIDENGQSIGTVSDTRADGDLSLGAIIDMKQSDSELTLSLDAAVDGSFTASMRIAIGETMTIDVRDVRIDFSFAIDADIVFGSGTETDGTGIWIPKDITMTTAGAVGIAVDIDSSGTDASVAFGDIDLDTGFGLYSVIETETVGGAPYFTYVAMNNMESFINDIGSILGLEDDTAAAEAQTGDGIESQSVSIFDFLISESPYEIGALPMSELGIGDIEKDALGVFAGVAQMDSASLAKLLLELMAQGDTGQTGSMLGGIDIETATPVLAELIGLFIGDDGLSASPSEISEMKRLLSSAMQSGRDMIAGIRSEVTFLKPQDDGAYAEAKSFEVNAGGSVPMDDAAIADLMKDTADGLRFVGWRVADVTVGADGSITVLSTDRDFVNIVYGDCYVVPVYAPVISGLDQTGPADTGTVVISGVVPTLDLSALSTQATYILEVLDAGALADKAEWSVTPDGIVRGMSTSVSVDAVSEVSVAMFEGKDLSKAFEVSFGMEQALPAGTTLTLYLGDRYAEGTTFEVYHIASGTVALTEASVVVDSRGAVTFDVPSCSSYVLVQGSIADQVPFDGSGAPPAPPGTDWLLFGGMAVAVIVLIGLAVLLFRRHH